MRTLTEAEQHNVNGGAFFKLAQDLTQEFIKLMVARSPDYLVPYVPYLTSVASVFVGCHLLNANSLCHYAGQVIAFWEINPFNISQLA